jgi:RecA-family ATPase
LLIGRTKEYQSAMEDQKRLNDVLQMELTELKAHTESSLNVSTCFFIFSLPTTNIKFVQGHLTGFKGIFFAY